MCFKEEGKFKSREICSQFVLCIDFLVFAYDNLNIYYIRSEFIRLFGENGEGL